MLNEWEDREPPKRAGLLTDSRFWVGLFMSFAIMAGIVAIGSAIL